MPITASIDSASTTARLKLFANRNSADCVTVTDGGDGTRQDKRQFARRLVSLHFVARRVHETTIVTLAPSILIVNAEIVIVIADWRRLGRMIKFTARAAIANVFQKVSAHVIALLLLLLIVLIVLLLLRLLLVGHIVLLLLGRRVVM